jgi:hypothetical protein
MIYAPDDDLTIYELLERIPAQPNGHVDARVKAIIEKLGLPLDKTMAELREIKGCVARALFLIKDGGPAQMAVAA